MERFEVCSSVPMIFNGDKLLLIAGPCMLESEYVAFSAAEKLIEIEELYPHIAVVFKGSFDKANRSSIRSARGPGLEEGLKILSLVKEKYGLKVTTDIHLPEQANHAAKVCDLLQIPAFLCRQTDLLVAAAHTGKSVSAKKGQFLSPQEMHYVVEKLREAGAKEIIQIERGASFGYNNLVVDMRSFDILKRNNCPAVFDATHSVQLPGGGNGVTIGQRDFVHILAKAAIAAGADGLFFEIHPNPDEALCDAANQLSFNHFARVIAECSAIWRVCKGMANN
ncbi:MAG: 3-deoxy-8-phosphooctulonate synthase [Puniceicoccales bacterium]|jgi:2-dehydro-3-deoxyphosphooctonate aldolase (KDO 8-P synthase)|nr:3-deoxy-8-phosphooctulonate synthase [Puniceicoccales bacterium]